MMLPVSCREGRRAAVRLERFLPAVLLVVAAIVLIVALVAKRSSNAPPTRQAGTKGSGSSTTTAIAAPANGKATATPAGSAKATPIAPAADKSRIDGYAIAGLQSKPVEGARVRAYRLTEEARLNPLAEPPVLDEATSGKDGAFTFASKPNADDAPLVWRVEADGYQAAVVLFTKTSQLTTSRAPAVRLEAAEDIDGRVVDEAGKGISGATLGEFFPANWATELPVDPVPLPSIFARSEADGHFLLKGVACVESRRRQQIAATETGPGKAPTGCTTPRSFPARAKGYIPADAGAIPGQKDVLIVLASREAGVRGKVLHADGTAAPGIPVSLILVPSDTDQPMAVPPLGFLTARSAADGSYAFPDLRAGTYNLNATRSEPPSFGGACAAEVQVKLARDQEGVQDLVFPKPATLAGRFVDAATQKPIADVKLMPFNSLNSPAAVTTDAEGKFKVEAYAPASPEGNQPAQIAVKVPAPYLLPEKNTDPTVAYWFDSESLFVRGIHPDAKVELEVELLHSLTAAGLVQEPDGKPAATVPLVYTFGSVTETISTDAEGRFGFPVLPGTKVQIGVASDQGSAIVEAPAEQAGDLKIRLEAYGSIAGRVVNEKKEPVPNVTVALQRQEEATGAALAVRRQVFATTEADGSFLLASIHPGDVMLALTMPPESLYTVPAPLPLVVSAAEKKTGVEIVLKEGDFLVGRVIDAEEKPIANAVLTTMLGAQGTKSWNSDAQGNFRIGGIPTDQPLAELTASAQGYEPQTLHNVSIFDKDVVFRLQRRGEVTVQVLRQTGQPAANFRLRLLRAVDGPAKFEEVTDTGAVTAADGRYKVKDLVGAAYRVEASETTDQGVKAGGTGSVDFVWPMGDAEPLVTVTLGSGLKLEGKVVDAKQSGVPGARVKLINPPLSMQRDATGPSGPPPVEEMTDGSGRFRFSGVPEGTYRLIASTDTSTSGEVSAKVAAGAEPAVLVLQPAPRVTGKVIDSKGNVPKLARLYAFRAADRSQNIARETSDGTFDIMLPEPGAWTVAASIDGTSDGTSRNVEVASGATKEVIFDFSLRLKLTGRVKVDGVSWEGDPGLGVRSSDGEIAILSPTGKDGAYECALPAGSWQLWLQSVSGDIPIGSSFALAAEPKDPKKDFDIPLATADLVVDTGGAETLPAATMLSLWTRSGGNEVMAVPGFSLDRPAVRLPRLPEGQYQARLTVGGKAAGNSDWTGLSAGQENHLVVVLTPPK